MYVWYHVGNKNQCCKRRISMSCVMISPT